MRTSVAELEAELEASSRMLRHERQRNQLVTTRATILAHELAHMQNECNAHIVRCANLLQQVHFYFSPANLNHDAFLLSQMDPATGFVSLEVIASFPRMRMFGATVPNLLALLQHSVLLEIDAEQRAVRLK